MATITDQAIVIRHWDFSETSQTVSLLTREHGLLRGLAKGSKRDKAPFSGGLELLTSGTIVAIVKPGRELATLTEWDLQEICWAARHDLTSHYLALYMVDLVHWGVRDSDPHPNIFDALRHTLRALADRSARAPATLRFLWGLLAEMGFRPRLDGADGATLGFSPERGGIVADPGPNAGPDTWRVRRDTVELLRSIEDARKMPDALPTGPHEDLARIVRCCRLLSEYLRFVLERDLPSRGPAMRTLADLQRT